MENEEILYNKIYEQTKNFGRTHFIKAIIKLQIENKELKAKIKSLTSKSTSKKLYGEYKHVRLTDKEYQTLIETYGQDLTEQLITYLDEYIEMKGYKAKNHYLCIRKWVLDAVKQNKYKQKKESLPEWFDQEYKNTTSPEEKAEMEELLKEFR